MLLAYPEGRSSVFRRRFTPAVAKVYDMGLTDALDRADLVYISTPPSTHFELARRHLSDGRHVIVEKPAVFSRKEAEVLIELAARKELVLVESFPFLHHAQWRLVPAGPTSRARFLAPVPLAGWRENPLEVGALGDFGVYPLRAFLDRQADMVEEVEVDCLVSVGGVPTHVSGVIRGCAAECAFTVGYSERFESTFGLAGTVLHKAFNPQAGEEVFVLGSSVQSIASDGWARMLECVLDMCACSALRVRARHDLLRQADAFEKLRKAAEEAVK